MVPAVKAVKTIGRRHAAHGLAAHGRAAAAAKAQVKAVAGVGNAAKAGENHQYASG